ncbi:MAG TPA: mandelate racemase/muconate lactonizing enzyme family protein [Bryobacteraceae bacterium]|nr:mandelate racemase/muconate lactonizing enzyme family protein [Bryobacteraceae bacterium]
MKIMGAKIYRVEVAGRHPVLLQLFTDDGVTGLGDAAVAYGSGSTAATALIEELVGKHVLGKNPANIEAIWHEMYDHSFWAKGGGSIILPAVSAIEMALWDIKARTLGVPLYELLGGRFRDKVWVYANGWSYRCHTLDELSREAEKVIKAGYTALKFYPLAKPVGPHGLIRHVSARTVDREAERWVIAATRAVRDAVGPDIEIMADMSGCLTTDVAIRIGQELEKYNLYFYEEPVDPFDVEALKKVGEHVRIPIAAGERLYTRYGFRRALEMRAVDILQPDPGATGGILETKYIAAMAETYSARVQLHTCSSPVATAVALQLDAGLPNLAIQEVYPFRTPQHWAIVDHAPELDIRNSYMPISERPGLGVELNQKTVDPFLCAECKL